MLKNKKYLVALIPFIIIVFMFEITPIITVIGRSFKLEGELGVTLNHYINIFSKKLYQQALVNSILIAFISSAIGLVIAFFGAKAYEAASNKMRDIFISILNMTSNFSGIPLAFAYIILLGNVGVFVLFGKKYGIDFLANFNIYSIPGLLICYVYFQIPLATLLIIPAFEGLKKEWREAVYILGGNSVTYWLKVGIPNLLPSILGTFSVLFANAISAFATGYALMQNNFSLLPIRISEQFIGDINQRPEFGSALAVVLMIIMVVTIIINNKVVTMSKGEVKNEKV